MSSHHDNEMTTDTYSSQEISSVIKRDGSISPFNSEKITNVLKKAFINNAETGDTTLSTAVREQIDSLTQQIVLALHRRGHGVAINIEDIQDQVELALMRSGEHQIARQFVIYRDKRQQQRTKDKAEQEQQLQEPTLYYKVDTGLLPLYDSWLQDTIKSACIGLESDVDQALIFSETKKNLYNEIPLNEVYKALILASRALIEYDPAYSKVTARLLLHTLYNEVLGFTVKQEEMQHHCSNSFADNIHHGITVGRIHPELATFDLERLSKALVVERDLQFEHLGMQTLYDRYFLHHNGKRFELPQSFFMRVAMGLAIKEINREEKAIEFYNTLSTFDFMCSTPTLFNSGTLRPQLSSCFLTTIGDSLEEIYDGIKEDALLSKYAGGLGNDWTPVRSLGSHIKGTNGDSQGVVPFMKVVNDTAVAVNQGGKRKGAICAYLETWHLDIEEYLELRKNVGDDRRRTHDMNTANWVPDLFMKRVLQDGSWTLFSPNEVPDLHDKYGKAFEDAYTTYEQFAEAGSLRQHKVVKAKDLWRKMLSMLFETGHPWITFKDPCNIRSPQQHVGVVHSSNLCVAPETLLLTDKGYIPISKLQDQTVTVWNGFQWSESIVKKTGVNQKLLNVKFSNGEELDCTPYHHFHIVDKVNNKNIIVDTNGLTINTQLIDYTLLLEEDDGTINFTQTVPQKGITVISIIDENRFDDTYCLNEPINHTVIFNGILTGNCTEITLNTNKDEIAVCNLGSVNLLNHLLPDGSIHHDKLKKTTSIAMRMLDNVIDINFYTVDKARNANQQHRPVGLGIMGFQECLYKLRIPFASSEAVEFADKSMEAVCYYAYYASTELAEERGTYSSYKGSLWDRGILPQDSVQLLAEERGTEYLVTNNNSAMDWGPLRDRLNLHGMRNSNCVAIAPTATISNIIGVSASIEPAFQNLYVKSNMSGEFTDINSYLVTELKSRQLWDKVMIADLKHFDGVLANIDRVPDDIKALFATAFEHDPSWLILSAARRQKWIDQAQSLNIYIAGASGKKIDETYKMAWLHGLKTTYYLRTQAATSVEKSSSKTGTMNAVSNALSVNTVASEEEGPACFLRPGDPGYEECEACQ